MSTQHPVQNERQRLEHRKLKLIAAKQYLGSIQAQLNECETKISNYERPGAMRDPVFAGQLPVLRERRDELVRKRNACAAEIERDYGDLLAEPPAPPKSLEQSLIETLQTTNAGLIERLSRCRCGAGAS